MDPARRTGQKARAAAAAAKSGAAKGARAAHAAARRLFRINLANTLTLLNGVSGFASILAAMNGLFAPSALLILAGVVLDWLDGKAARFFDEETALGGELDSLSDLVSFGVAPAVLVAAIAPSTISYVAGGLFVLSAALRLGRFNVEGYKGAFVGVPTTTNGIALPALVIWGAPLVIYPWYLLALAFLMNAPLRVRKPF